MIKFRGISKNVIYRYKYRSSRDCSIYSMWAVREQNNVKTPPNYFNTKSTICIINCPLKRIYTIKKYKCFFHRMYRLVTDHKTDFLPTVISLNISLFSKQYPCGTDHIKCERPYSFLHRLSLTSNLSAFIVSNQTCFVCVN